MSAFQENPRKPKETRRKATPTGQDKTPDPPTRGARPWEVGQWLNPTGKTPGGWLAEPPGQGPPCRVPGTPRSVTYSMFRQVWRVKRPSNSTKEKTITTVSKRALQRARITLIRYWHFKKSTKN